MNMHYLLLPGNPPAAYFYECWRQEIMSQQIGAEAKVSVYPLLSSMDDSAKTAETVLAFHFEQLCEFHKKTGKPVTLIGHSLGGHFAMKLLERAQHQIKKVILVHPFLRAPELQGQIILNIASALQGREKLQKILLQSRKGLEYFLSDLPYVTNDEILTSFHLGKLEHATIGRDHSPIHIHPELRAKTQVLYTRNDIWCRSQVVDELKLQISVHECSEPHDFVTSEKHRRSLFQKILELSP